MKKWIAFALALALALCALLTACAGSSGKFESYVKNGDYQKAAALYSDKIAGNSKLEIEAETFLTQYLQESWDSYESGKTDDETLDGVLRTLENLCSQTGIWLDLFEVEYQHETLRASRASFAEAEASMQAEDYLTAIRQYRAVSPDDEDNYATAQNAIGRAEDSYQQQVLTLAQGHLDAGEYSTAVETVKAAEQAFGTTDEFESFIARSYAQFYAEQLQSAFDAGDYIQVKSVYEEAGACEYDVITAEMTSLFAQSQTAYQKTVLDEAEAAFGEAKDYEAAIRVINAAMAEYGETDAFTEKLEYYQSYAPVYLTSLEGIRVGREMEVGYAIWGRATDVLGTEYNSDTVITTEDPSADRDSPDNSAYFYLNAEYSTLTGIVYRPHQTLSCEYDWTKSPVAEIYGDGVLLYSAPEFTMQSYDPVTFTLDVSGVKELRIFMEGGWRNNALDYFYQPKLCFAEITIQK